MAGVSHPAPSSVQPAEPEEPPRSAQPRRWRDRPSWLRWTAYVAIVVVLALVVAAGFAVETVRKSFPQTSGTIDVPGLSAEVTVVRDAYGVPQIYADNAADLFFAQGYVQAQDRFFQMDVRRHLAAGRLSEMFGVETLETDKVVRTLGWHRVAEQEVADLDPQTTRYLESFSAGVNAYIGDRSPSELSLEYALLGLSGHDYEVEKWSPADSVAWLKAMAWDLRGNMQDEVDRAMASTRLDASQIAQLYPDYPYDRNQPTVRGGAVVDGAFDQDAPPGSGAARAGLDPAAVEALRNVQKALSAVPTVVGTGSGVGSNAWVVDGNHSTTGQPILANDPHLAPSVPGVWYQMGLHCTEVSDACPFDVSGFTFAGFPGVVIGHNQQIAWGFASMGADVSDLYLEAVDGERYLRGKKWREFDRRQETINVAGEEPFTFTVRSSVHGPLLSDVSPLYASVGANAPAPPTAPDRGTGYAVSLAWTALRKTRTAAAVFDLDRATSWDELRGAARKFAAPNEGIVYADRDGHIGYQAAGLVPIRRSVHLGDYPAPGWDRAYDWTGRFVPFDALPSVLDPENGYLTTANQPPVDPSYPYFLGNAWDYGYRSQRINDLLKQKGTLSVGDMSRMQLDTRNGLAPVLVPYLLRVDAGSHYYSAGQQLLADWDFTQAADSPAAAYYNAVWRNLLELTFRDQVPVSVGIDGGSRWFEVVRRLLKQPNDPWWDDTSTDTVREGRDDILRSALREARDELVQRQSRRPDHWTWGHQHTLTLVNEGTEQANLGFLGRLVNRGTWPLPGGSSVVDATGWDASLGYEAESVPSMRMVVSLADLDDSTWVNLTGASGHAFDGHYTDQTDRWAAGETLPWRFSRDAVEAGAADTLTLRPGGTS